MTERNSSIRCSGCGKQEPEAKRLIAGPTVFICDECAESIALLQADPAFGKDPRYSLPWVRLADLPDNITPREKCDFSGEPEEIGKNVLYQTTNPTEGKHVAIGSDTLNIVSDILSNIHGDTFHDGSNWPLTGFEFVHE